jgi:hypothetical protein
MVKAELYSVNLVLSFGRNDNRLTKDASCYESASASVGGHTVHKRFQLVGNRNIAEFVRIIGDSTPLNFLLGSDGCTYRIQLPFPREALAGVFHQLTGEAVKFLW